MVLRTVEREIEAHLEALEAAHDVKVLYAVESGSRAWGFPSPDSDYDVRFVYVHRIDWYLSVQKRRDVLEAIVDPDLDFAGWDLRKTLSLLQKSNPSLLEWMGSPIVYRQDRKFMDRFRGLAQQCLSLRSCHHHYVSMAQSNWTTYFKEELVSLKKYLYVLRPLFACRWIERYQTTPPVAFETLVEGAGEPGAVMAELNQLLAAKSQTSEIGVGLRRPILDRFIQSEIDRLQSVLLTSSPPIPTETLDAFFRLSLNLHAQS